MSNGPINHPTPILSQKTLYNKTINIDRHIYITIQGFFNLPSVGSACIKKKKNHLQTQCTKVTW